MSSSKSQKSSIFSSFKFAFSGIWQVLKKERNLKVHFLAALLVVILGFIFNISRLEWLVIILLIGIIFTAEIFNSAIEKTCDLLRNKLNLKYGETTFIRNASAAAVLVLAMVALLIGFLVFVF